MIIDRRPLLRSFAAALVLGAAHAPLARARSLSGQSIRQLDERTYRVNRAALRAEMAACQDCRSYVASPFRAISRSARIIPELRDGKPAGLRLRSVQQGGPIARLGLQDGDLVQAVNGLPLGSPEQAVAAFSQLKTAARVSVLIERDGQTREQVYLLR
jgi:general secretion pathway protein C